jgi:hypothetical protein
MSKDGVIEIQHITDEIIVITESDIAVIVNSEVNDVLIEHHPFDIHFRESNIITDLN